MIVSLIKKAFHRAHLPKIEKEGGVVESKYLEINGAQQWIYVRGGSKSNPVLLFLHPGPGFVATGLASGYQTLLEKHFIVVHWHMRGAGKSYSKAISKEKMSIALLVEDAIELSQQLIKHYQKNDLYIMGHSFGSLIGFKAVKKKPAIFKHFISIAQMTHVAEMEKRSFDFALECATKEGDSKSLKSLEQISRSVDELTVDGIKKKQEIIHKFGGCAPGFDSILDLIRILIINPVEHSFSDVMKTFSGFKYSGAQLFTEACEVNFFEEISNVEIPVLMILGENDQISNPELVKSYFDQLQAPKKELIELKGDAHFSFLSQPEAFQNKLLETLGIR